MKQRNLHLQRIIAWSLRGFILWAVLTGIQAPDARAIMGAPQTVKTKTPHLCVHTRLIDEVSEWKIQKSLEYVAEMGATTIVEFFPWAYIEPEQGVYNWEQSDRIVRHAQNLGINIIARTGFVPHWARPDTEETYTTLNYLPDESFDEFADFAARFAERYQGTINHIIVWNEPNLAFEWGYRDIRAADYVRLLTATYPRIKAANPDAVVLAGALAPTLEPRGSANGLNDVIYLEDMYEAGAAAYFDALAVHTYGFTHPPDAEPAIDTLNFRRAELLHDVMLKYDDEKPVFITESGWNDNHRWVMGVRPASRIQYTIDALEMVEDDWQWANKMCIWVLRYPAPTLSYPDNFTLVTPAFQRKPIFQALKAYAAGEQRSEALWLPPPES